MPCARGRVAKSFVTGSDLPVVFGNLVTYVTRVVRQLSGSSNASCVARCESLPDGTEMVGRVPDRADRHAQCVLVPHGVSLHRHNQTLVLAPESPLYVGPTRVVDPAHRPTPPAIAPRPLSAKPTARTRETRPQWRATAG